MTRTCRKWGNHTKLMKQLEVDINPLANTITIELGLTHVTFGE